MTSFLIGETVVVDAGSTTEALSIDEQRRIRHVLVSHSHMDHTASLPFLVENIFDDHQHPVTIHSTKGVLALLRRAIFNNDTWPDFTRIPNDLAPLVQFVEVQPEVPFTIEGLENGPLKVLPVTVDHVVPTVGFVLRQGDVSLVYTSDTGPTTRIWDVANATPDLGAVIVECSFPERLQHVAEVGQHLTPATLARELEKLDGEVPVYLSHFKPAYLDELRREVAAVSFPQPVEELVQDREYELVPPAAHQATSARR